MLPQLPDEKYAEPACSALYMPAQIQSSKLVR